VLQRLEPDKDTLTALRAWQTSELAREGWSLRITGTGAERASLEAFAAAKRIPNVTFAGWTAHVAEELAAAGMLLAPGPADSFGFSVVEAMAAGVPVVASAAGGHLETVGRLPGAALFPAGDAAAAAASLRCMLPADVRAAASRAGRELVRESFTIARHVDELLVEYEAVSRPGRFALPAEASAR
jgi:glycosyltransferase involved in cell wall biosynthesis